MNATAKAPARPVRAARIALLLIAAAAAAIVGWFLWNFDSYRGQARLGTAYAARMACSCVHVQKRPFDQCTADFEPGMEPISLAQDGTRITATYPLLGSAAVRYNAASGCQPED